MAGRALLILVAACGTYGWDMTENQMLPEHLLGRLVPDCNDIGSFCMSCSEILFCLPDGEVDRFNCSAIGPYCQDSAGVCGIQPDLNNCGEADASFACAADGQFPDPKNCSRFHYCRGGSSKVYDCPNEYDPRSGTCSQTKCKGPPIDCASHPDGVKIPFEKNGMFFSICLNGEVVYTDKCDDGSILNPRTQLCEKHCQYSS